MNAKQKRRVLWAAGGFVGGLVLLIGFSLVVVQTRWFSNLLRTELVTALENSSGGKVDIGSFQFDASHLTLRIGHLVVHGTEPRAVPPLAAISRLELKVKLFPAFFKFFAIEYLNIQEPRVNVIVKADGSTNIPTPKIKSAPSSKSPLATIVDLAVGHFQIEKGSLAYSQKTFPIDIRGENLRVLLNYNQVNASYQGKIELAGVRIARATNAGLMIRADFPISLNREGIQVTNARLLTDRSELDLDASLKNLAEPKLTAKARIKLSLLEMRRMLTFAGEGTATGALEFMTADIDAGWDESKNVLEVRTLHAALGQSTLDAAGTANAATDAALPFRSSLVVAELIPLLGLTSPRVQGDLQVKGSFRLDALNNYFVNGTLASSGLSMENGFTRLSNVALSTPFQINPHEISLNPIRISALQGTLTGKLLLRDMRDLSVQAELQQMSLRALVSAFAGHSIDYGAALSATATAHSDLQTKGKLDFSVQSQISLTPRREGVPLQGRLNVGYEGKNGSLTIQNSFVSFPNSRLVLSGSARDLAANLTSRNLEDFLPLVNFGASQRMNALPVKLKGGMAHVEAHLQGALNAPQIKAHGAVTNFAIKEDLFNQLSLDLWASPSGAAIQNGLLARNNSRSTFTASIGLRQWRAAANSPVAADITIRDADLGDLLAMGGTSAMPLAGEMNADIHIKGTYGDPLGSASLQIPHGRAYGQPFDELQGRLTLTPGVISLDAFEASTAQGKLSANARFQHSASSLTTGQVEMHLRSEGLQLAAFEPLQKKSPGTGGVIELTADVTGRLGNKQNEFTIKTISGRLSAGNLRVANQDAGSLTAIASTAADVVTYNVKSNFAGSNTAVDGHTKLSADYATEAKAAIEALPVQRVLEIIGQSNLPVTGLLTAHIAASGTAQAPDVSADLDLSKASAFEEPISHLAAKLHYTDALTEISSINLEAPAGKVSLHGRYQNASHADRGTLLLSLNSSDLEVAKLAHVQLVEPGLQGTIRFTADLAANVIDGKDTPQILLSRVDSDIQAKALHLNKQTLGDLTFSARTVQSKVNFQLDSNVAQSKIHAAGESQLAPGYPTRAKLTFNEVRYANLAPFLGVDQPVTPSFDALLDGSASVDGPIANIPALKARMELSRLEVRGATRPKVSDASAGKTALLQNDGPIVASLDHSLVQVNSFRLRGPKTSLELSGAVDFANATHPLRVKLSGESDLEILQDMDQKFYSSGKIGVDVSVAGSFTEPAMNGKIELKGANLNYADLPNGLSNGNGVIQLNGTTATLQNLTGESGGGKIAISGFAGLSPRAVIYNLRAKAANVRIRYASVSLTSNADIALTGNSRRSLLAGKVTIQRIAYSSSSDIGSLLSNASTPPTTSSTSTPFLAGMRMDIGVTTASDVRILTSYVEKLDVNSALTVRGTAAQPSVLGRVNITAGQLAFFGNTYTVNRGAINFFDASTIRPELNFSLETVAQGVDVVLSVTGPMDHLNLTYRSDPPLTFEQIVQLLATNTTPFDPTIAAHQPTPPQQSTTQMGESAVLGQAIANPLASRVQRIFGLSQFKIDPSIAGSNGQPSAKVSIQQKIANNITFTYITDVTQSNSEIVRIQWDLGGKTSAVALRDFNGNVSVEIFHKFQVR